MRRFFRRIPDRQEERLRVAGIQKLANSVEIERGRSGGIVVSKPALGYHETRKRFVEWGHRR